MIFGMKVELIWAACIINLFLLCIWTMGYLMVNESQNAWGYFFGWILTVASSWLQSFALAYCLSSFIK